jgi:hypothetical protein
MVVAGLWAIYLSYDDMVLLTLAVPLGCGVALTIIGMRNKSKLGLNYGILHVLVIIPLLVNEFPGGWQPSITVGKILLTGFIVIWATTWASRSITFVILGGCGAAGFASHVFLIANTP